MIALPDSAIPALPDPASPSIPAAPAAAPLAGYDINELSDDDYNPADPNDPAEIAALAELAELQASSYRSLGPVLAITVTACELLWQMAAKQPVVAELRRRTGLNPRTLAALKAVATAEEFANLWTDRLPDYYYALLVGRLILESPLRPMLRAMLNPSAGEDATLDKMLVSVADIVKDLAPMTERWLVGQFNAGPKDPLPTDPAARAQLVGWETRRADLEAYFASVADEFEHVSNQYLRLQRAAAAPPPPRGPFLRRTFTDAELAALRLLLTYVPTLTTLLPGQPFAKAMHALSALQPPARVEELLQRLRAIKPGQPLHFALPDCLTLLQTLQAGALLLLRASGGELVRTLRHHTIDPNDPDEDLRIDRGRLLFLLTDDTTRTQFRAVFKPLLQHFSAAVDRLYPYAPELTKARAELADLAAVR